MVVGNFILADYYGFFLQKNGGRFSSTTTEYTEPLFFNNFLKINGPFTLVGGNDTNF